MGELVNAQDRYIAADRKLARKYQLTSRAPETWKNNIRHWQQFSNYLGSVDPWKATPEDVAAFIANLAGRGYSTRSITGSLCSLRFYYTRLGKGFEHGQIGKGVRKDNPVNTEFVRATMRGIRRVHGRPPRRKEPILLDSLERIIDQQPDTIYGVRNKALFSLAWASAARVGEICGMDASSDGDGDSYVEFIEDGLVVVFRRRKNLDPSDLSQRLIIPARITVPNYCPRILLRRWMDVSGIEKGPLFRGIYGGEKIIKTRVARHSLSRILQAAVATIGLQPEQYAMRSLRSGCITWLAMEGLSTYRIMEHSGHKRMESMQSYLQPVRSIKSCPLAETRWCG